LAPIVTTDQHDRTLRTEPTTRTLLFAADKKASDLVTEVLQPFGADALTARQAVFIADIHAMPALITRMFALPALRQMPFAIGLVRDAALTADLPRNKESGLRHVLEVLREVEGISFTFFGAHDVVRHPLVQRIVAAYEAWDQNRPPDHLP
jgi:hypothetical protein